MIYKVVRFLPELIANISINRKISNEEASRLVIQSVRAAMKTSDLPAVDLCSLPTNCETSNVNGSGQAPRSFDLLDYLNLRHTNELKQAQITMLSRELLTNDKKINVLKQEISNLTQRIRIEREDNLDQKRLRGNEAVVEENDKRIKSLEKKVRKLKTEMTDLEAYHTERYDKLLEEKAQLKRVVNTLKNNQVISSDCEAKLKSIVLLIDPDNPDVDQAKSKLLAILNSVNENKETIKRTNSQLKSKQRELDEILSKCAKKDKKITGYQNEIRQLKTEIDTIAKNREELLQRNATLARNEELEKTKGELRAQYQQMETLNAQLKDIQKKFAELTESRKQAEQSLTEKDKLLTECNTKLNEIQALLNNAEIDKNNLQLSNDMLNERIRKLNDEIVQKAAATGDVDQVQLNENQSLKQSMNTLEETNLALKQTNNQLRGTIETSNANYAKLSQKNSELENANEEALEEIARLKLVQENQQMTIGLLETNLRTYKTDLEELDHSSELRLSERDDQIKNYKARISDLENKIATLESDLNNTSLESREPQIPNDAVNRCFDNIDNIKSQLDIVSRTIHRIEQTENEKRELLESVKEPNYQKSPESAIINQFLDQLAEKKSELEFELQNKLPALHSLREKCNSQGPTTVSDIAFDLYNESKTLRKQVDNIIRLTVEAENTMHLTDIVTNNICSSNGCISDEYRDMQSELHSVKNKLAQCEKEYNETLAKLNDTIAKYQKKSDPDATSLEKQIDACTAEMNRLNGIMKTIIDSLEGYVDFQKDGWLEELQQMIKSYKQALNIYTYIERTLENVNDPMIYRLLQTIYDQDEVGINDSVMLLNNQHAFRITSQITSKSTEDIAKEIALTPIPEGTSKLFDDEAELSDSQLPSLTFDIDKSEAIEPDAIPATKPTPRPLPIVISDEPIDTVPTIVTLNDQSTVAVSNLSEEEVKLRNPQPEKVNPELTYKTAVITTPDGRQVQREVVVKAPKQKTMPKPKKGRDITAPTPRAELYKHDISASLRPLITYNPRLDVFKNSGVEDEALETYLRLYFEKLYEKYLDVVDTNLQPVYREEEASIIQTVVDSVMRMYNETDSAKNAWQRMSTAINKQREMLKSISENDPNYYTSIAKIDLLSIWRWVVRTYRAPILAYEYGELVEGKEKWEPMFGNLVFRPTIMQEYRAYQNRQGTVKRRNARGGRKNVSNDIAASDSDSNDEPEKSTDDKSRDTDDVTENIVAQAMDQGVENVTENNIVVVGESNVSGTAKKRKMISDDEDDETSTKFVPSKVLVRSIFDDQDASSESETLESNLPETMDLESAIDADLVSPLQIDITEDQAQRFLPS